VGLRLSDDMERVYALDNDGNDVWSLPALAAEPMVPDHLLGAYLALLAEIEDAERAAIGYMAEAEHHWRNR
jgi:hypothetical protein